MKRQLYYILTIMLLAVVPVYGQGAGAGVGPAPGVGLQDEGVSAGRVQILNCVGTSIACTKSGVTGTISTSSSIIDQKAIFGLTYANDGTDVINDIAIAAGGAIDSAGTYLIVGAASIKQSDVAWAVGTNAGCLDAGAVGNNDYYAFIIARSDTGVVDYLCSLSATAPAMPASYNKQRLFAWYKRAGGLIVLFTVYEEFGGGIRHLWNTPTLDVNLANTLTTARRTDAVKVPLGFAVTALLRGLIDDASVLNVLIMSPDETDTAVSATAAPGVNIRSYVAGIVAINELSIRTSATGTIAARAFANTMDSYRVITYGFLWSRR